MSKKLLSPDAVRDFLVRRFNNQHRNWLLGQGSWPILVSLGLPTEEEAVADPASIRNWVQAWLNWSGPGNVRSDDRQWSRLGVQTLPTHLEVSSPEEVASVAGQLERWLTAKERYAQLVGRWPSLAGTPRIASNFNVLADYSVADFSRLVTLLQWLSAHPSSGLTLRQLPVEGLDTKWIETRTGVVLDLFKEISGLHAEGDIFAVCGLRKSAHRIRVRVLCPELRRLVGGLGDIEAPADQLAELQITPSKAIVVENLDTGIALPDIPSCVALMKLGNAVRTISTLPWLRSTMALYWGDLDTHGFAILNQAREVLPSIRSLLMDEATLLRYRPLWSRESVQCADHELANLTHDESAVYRGLRANTWGRNVRLEQERIAWSDATSAINSAFN